ncbi:MAG: hypothetical protein JWO35_522 [Candidatus Saccharibacteria bacterium]|nr:hypothetical protein [Candidatus Saccharibacteria bacterium]
MNKKQQTPLGIAAQVVASTKLQEHAGVTWIDVENPRKEDLAGFVAKYNLHELQIDECLNKGHLPQVEVEPDYVFVLLHFPKYVADQHKIETDQVGIFLGRNYLLTVHGDETPSIRNFFDVCNQDREKQALYFEKSTSYLLHAIIEQYLKDLANLIHDVSCDLDNIEDMVFDGKESDAYQIGQLRHRIMRIRRILAPLQEVLDDLSSVVADSRGENIARYYRNNKKMANRLWEEVEEARETIEIYKDADFTASTGKTNAILAVLTLLFTLTIPATVIGTFYGMNILLPGGLTTGSWTFLGAYTTLKMVGIGSGLLALLMYYYFKKRSWV